jgi:hypothetical protein
MPWEIVETDTDCGGDTPWGVRNTESGDLEGCHASRDEAMEQVAALNSAEDSGEEAGAEFEAVLVVEGEETIDGRIFDLDAVEWRDTPLTLMAMTEGEHGGMAAPVSRVAGRIDEITRDPARPGVILARGRLSGSAFGAEVEALIREGSLQRISVDASTKFSEFVEEAVTVDGDGMPLDIRTTFRRAVLVGATVVPFSAFSPTHIWLAGMPEPAEAAAAEGGEVEPITEPEVVDSGPSLLFALTATHGGPARPPADWFTLPEPDEWQPFRIEEDGLCHGHVAPWRRCHTGYQEAAGVCRVAQRSSPGLPFFHIGRTLCADGTYVETGPLTMDTLHAGDQLDYASTLRHYSDTGNGAADLHCIDGELGIWACGALRPGLTDREIRALNGTQPSIDQRPIDHQLELSSILMVNKPGLPRPRWAMRNGEQLSLVASAAVRCDDGDLLAPEVIDLTRPAGYEITFTPEVEGFDAPTREDWERIEMKMDHLISMLTRAFGAQVAEQVEMAMRPTR